MHWRKSCAIEFLRSGRQIARVALSASLLLAAACVADRSAPFEAIDLELASQTYCWDAARAVPEANCRPVNQDERDQLTARCNRWIDTYSGRNTCSFILARYPRLSGNYTYDNYPYSAKAWSYANSNIDWNIVNFQYPNSQIVDYFFFHELAHIYYWAQNGSYENQADADAGEAFAHSWGSECSGYDG